MKSFIEQYFKNLFGIIKVLILTILTLLSVFSISINIIALMVICFGGAESITNWSNYILILLSVIPSIAYLVTLDNYRG